MYSCFCLAKTVMDLLCLLLAPVTVKQGCSFVEEERGFPKNWSPGGNHKDWPCGCLLIYRAQKLHLFSLMYIFSIEVAAGCT